MTRLQEIAVALISAIVLAAALAYGVFRLYTD